MQGLFGFTILKYVIEKCDFKNLVKRLIKSQFDL
jgi:hypothetical protein